MICMIQYSLKVVKLSQEILCCCNDDKLHSDFT